uniref:hypothetical protein n=1 Tax=Burkholderia vietnamiensis TaxID=60552 RepID=UPI001E5A8D95
VPQTRLLSDLLEYPSAGRSVFMKPSLRIRRRRTHEVRFPSSMNLIFIDFSLRRFRPRGSTNGD